MKKLGLIGFPLGHSFSAQYFSEKFEKLGLHDHRYKVFPLESIEDLPDLIRNEPSLFGFNVTIPHKQSIIPFLDDLSPQAEAIGAVNTVRIQKGQLEGYNTDYYGFQAMMEGFTHYDQALVLGNGGASQAVQFVLKEMHIPFTLVSRKSGLSYAEITADVIRDHKLIVNTTSLGMSPNTSDAPELPYTALTKQHALLDLIYNPEETHFMKKGSENGAQTLNGLKMLYAQAEASWKIWTS